MITNITARFRAGWRRLRSQKDAGYSTEAVIATAVLVAGALIVLAIIVSKVTDKAESIDLGMM